MPKVRFGNHSLSLPQSRALRITIGVLLVLAGGLGGWLPVLGFWMVPLGLLILSADIPSVRRWYRRTTVRLVGWWRGRKSRDERIATRNGKPATGVTTAPPDRLARRSEHP